MELQGFENKARPIGVLGVKISQGGEVIAHKTWDEECRRNVYSASKSVTSCAVGFAVQEGLLSLEERLVDAFAQDLPETVSENLERATVRDLLTMCLGQARGELMGAQRPLYQERDWVKLALSFFPGEQPVVLYYQDIRKQSKGYCMIHPSLLADLRERLGEGNVVVQ